MMKLRKKVTYAVLTVVCLMLIVPMICHMFPFLVGADSSFKAVGGSMFPTIKEGDLIFNKAMDPSTYTNGDILTVKPGDTVYTHRVCSWVPPYGNFEGGFMLQGDANEDPDPVFIKPHQIIGKVVFIVPFSFLDTPFGFILTLIVPGVLIVGKQIHLIMKKDENSSLDMTTLLLAIILVFSLTRIIAPYLEGSNAYFSDVESASVGG